MHHPSHHRRSIRLKGHDYRYGTYFVTMCTHDRQHLLGEVHHGIVGLSTIGCIVADAWQRTAIIRPYVHLDTWCVMPNHIHAILRINQCGNMPCPLHVDTSLPVGASYHDAPTLNHDDTPSNDDDDPSNGDDATIHDITTTHVETQTKFVRASYHGAPMPTARLHARSLGAIIGQFKIATTKRIRQECGHDCMIWQRNYHEHIIRLPDEYHRIQQYILQNPSNWHDDEMFIP